MPKHKTAQSESEPLYFIVEADDLSKYGSQLGSAKAEAEKMLAEAGESIGDLVVIRGVVINPTFKLD